MTRTRFVPSPTGSLHAGNWLLLWIDDTDPARNVAGGEEQLLRDLGRLDLEWDDGPEL